MHELSLCESILEIIETEAQQKDFKSVKAVWLEIGEFAAVEEQAMHFCFDMVIKNSIADSALLHIDTLTGQGTCESCKKTVPLTTRFDPCPECGHVEVQITQGEEMRIKELEVT